MVGPEKNAISDYEIVPSQMAGVGKIDVNNALVTDYKQLPGMFPHAAGLSARDGGARRRARRRARTHGSLSLSQRVAVCLCGSCLPRSVQQRGRSLQNLRGSSLALLPKVPNPNPNPNPTGP